MKTKFIGLAVLAVAMLMLASTPAHAQPETQYAQLQTVAIDAPITVVETIDIACSDGIAHQTVYADLMIGDTDLDSVGAGEWLVQVTLLALHDHAVVPLRFGKRYRTSFDSAKYVAHTRGFSHPLRC